MKPYRRSLALLAALALALSLAACGGPAGENASSQEESAPAQSSSTPMESAPEESIPESAPEASVPAESAPEENAPEEAPVQGEAGGVYDWTDDPERAARLEELRKQGSLTDEEALELAGSLAAKARYLVYLGYGEGIVDGGPPLVEQADLEKGAEVENRASGRAEVFYPVSHLPYGTAEELWEAVCGVFAPETTPYHQLGAMLYDPEDGSGLYATVGGRLYIRSGVSGAAAPVTWDFAGAEVTENTPEKIAVRASATMHETKEATLELVWRDGAWRLNDSYFAS